MGDYEKRLDELITEINADDGMPVDAYHVVLMEFNTRILCKILDSLEELKDLLKKE